MRLFHGGKPGLKTGDEIVAGSPHYVEGCEVCDAHKAGAEVVMDGNVVDPANHEPGRVFVTTDREYARFYASKYPRGDLYTVDIIGEFVPSPEDPFPSGHVECAVVRGVADRYVELTTGQRSRLLKRWKVADDLRLKNPKTPTSNPRSPHGMRGTRK